METNNNEFNFTYSAKDTAEVKRIREKYEKRDEDKFERLKRLDRGVGKKAQAVAIAVGIIGALILGSGMSLFMSELPVMLGLETMTAWIIGFVLGVVGAVLVSLAYPIYSYIYKRERAKAAPEILRLADEIMK